MNEYLQDLEYFQQKLHESIGIPSYMLCQPNEKPAPNIVYGSGFSSNSVPRFRPLICANFLRKFEQKCHDENFDRAMKVVSG